MFKRILALVLSLALCLSLSALAEEPAADVPDNETLFWSGLSGALESCDPLSQALALTVKDSFQHFSLNLQPAGSGLRLDVSSFMEDAGEFSAALEAGTEALWILMDGQTLEVPYSLFMPLVEAFSASPSAAAGSGDLDALIAKYQGPLSLWAMKAWTLLSPMVTVTDTSTTPIHVHISGDARQLTTALVTLTDEILADTRTVSSLLEDLKPFLTAAGAEEIPDAQQLAEAWQAARRTLLSDPGDASLTLDASVEPQSKLFSLAGTLVSEGEQLNFDAQLYPGTSYGAYSFSASFDGDMLSDGRVELNLDKVLASYPGNAAARSQTYKVSGSAIVWDSGSEIKRITLDLTEIQTVTGRYQQHMEIYDGTLKYYEYASLEQTLDFGLTIGSESVSLRLAKQNGWGETESLRLFASPQGLDLHADEEYRSAAVNVVLSDEETVSYIRVYSAEPYYDEFTEFIYDGEKVFLRDDEYETVGLAEYPEPDHMVLLLTRTEWDSDDEPETVRVDVTQPGGECVLLAVFTGPDGEESLRAELTKAPAAPIPSLGEAENRTVLTMDVLMQILSGESPFEAVPEAEEAEEAEEAAGLYDDDL